MARRAEAVSLHQTAALFPIKFWHLENRQGDEGRRCLNASENNTLWNRMQPSLAPNSVLDFVITPASAADGYIPQEGSPGARVAMLLLPAPPTLPYIQNPPTEREPQFLHNSELNTTLKESVMETTILEQFQALYPGRRINEAALFVGDRVVLASQHDRPVYEGALDRFVSRETAQEQQIIR